MRKYYKVSKSRKRLLGSSFGPKDPWNLLSVYVRGNASLLGLDYTSDLLSCCSSRSVAQYLSIGKRIESSTTLYDDFDAFFVARQAVSLLKKYPFIESDLELTPRQTAELKLRESEEKCKETNERLREISVLPRVIIRARRLIAALLDDLTPSLVMKIIGEVGKHGPGATLSNKGNKTTPYFKYWDFPYTCTRDALPYAYAAISSNPFWMEILEDSGRRKEIPPAGCPLFQKELMILKDCVVQVEHDRIMFVPKDARTERPIAVGASLNIFLQLGVKSYLEERLKSVNIDLTDQTRNQHYAKLGSQFYKVGQDANPAQFSTIDLASASDTISYELVKMLLPSDWFSFLLDLRHHSGDLDGSILLYEKFCAMGNGYTFPLETLIFWSIASAAAQENGYPSDINNLTVYGDDIICRLEAAPHVLEWLEWAGFSVNSDKSFLSGPFKESCGSDYLKGRNVRPFFLKRELKRYADLYHLCNSLAENCRFHQTDVGSFNLYSSLLEEIPIEARLYVPYTANQEEGLKVPFNFVSTRGLRPFLNKAEITSLLRSRVIDPDDACLQSMYYLSYQTFPRRYSGRGKVLYFVAIHTYLPYEASKFHEGFSVEEDSTGRNYVTRRKSVTYAIRIRRTPNWCSSDPRMPWHPIWVS